MNSLRGKIRAFGIRLWRTLRPSGDVGELDQELEVHIAMQTEAGVQGGLDVAEARRQALLKLGGAEQARQAQRERAGLVWLENLAQDLQYGMRTMLRAPGFAVTAILTVGLGIGACTAIFSLVNAVLIRSLPYGDPERLVYLFTPNPNLKIPAEVICPAYGDYFDIRRENHSFAAMSNFEQAMFSLDERGTIQRIGSAACAWIVTGVLKSFLFGLSEHDPITAVSISLLMIVCGLIAAFVPARRAAFIEPMQALRTE
jgi:hypothetical protein